MIALLLIAALTAPPRVALDQPSAQAVSTGGVTVVLDPDLLHLSGFGRAGRRLWRRPHQKKARGIQALFEHDGRVLIYAGESIRVVDPRTGRTGKAVPAPFLGSPGHPGCWLNAKGGAHAFSCPCRFQLSLDDGRPVGDPYRFHRKCERDADGEGSSCGCWGSDGDLIGRAGDLSLARVDEPPTATERRQKRTRWGHLLVALSLKTSKEVWRQPSPLGEPAAYINGLGIMPSGKTFWTATADGRIAGHDVATGRLLWRHPAAGGEGVRPHQPGSRVAALPGDGLFFFANNNATLHDARTGQARWQVPAPEAVLAIPDAALPTDEAWRLRSKGRLRVLHVADGTTRASLTLTHDDAHVLRDGEQILILDGAALRLHDLNGRPLANAMVPAPATLSVAASLVVVAGTDEVAILDRTTLTEVGRVPGRRTVIALEGELGPRRLLLDGPDDRIRLLEVPAAPGR